MTYLKNILSILLIAFSIPGLAQTSPIANPANPSGQASPPSPANPDTTHPDPIRDSAFRFAETIFSRPRFVFQTLQPAIPADMQPILIRMNNAIMENKDWFIQYRAKQRGSGLLPYDEHFGITPEEYRKVQNMESQPPQLEVADSQNVTTHTDNGLIQLHSDGSTHLIDYLFIDIPHQLLMYGGDTIPFQGRAKTLASDPYGQWQGYIWRLERTDIQSSIESGKPTARVIEVDLGTPRKPNVTYIRIEYQDMKAGVTTANMELIGYIPEKK